MGGGELRSRRSVLKSDGDDDDYYYYYPYFYFYINNNNKTLPISIFKDNMRGTEDPNFGGVENDVFWGVRG